ncbi:MAG: hypothetical protein MJ231_06060 [bacterium]|nr:hypothetical protein [bacterium]
MAAVSTSATYLLTLQAEYNNDILEQMKWSQLQKNNASKLAAMERAQNAWQDAYDKASDCNRSSALKMDGEVFLDKEVAANEQQATQWADYKAPTFDEDILDELEDLDVSYTCTVELLNSKIELEKTEIENAKQLTSEAAQDTGLLNQ